MTRDELSMDSAADRRRRPPAGDAVDAACEPAPARTTCSPPLGARWIAITSSGCRPAQGPGPWPTDDARGGDAYVRGCRAEDGRPAHEPQATEKGVQAGASVVLTAPHAWDSAAWLIGKIADENGVPLRDANIQARHRESGQSASTRTIDAEGAFKVGPLPPGHFTLYVSPTSLPEMIMPVAEEVLPSEVRDVGTIRARHRGPPPCRSARQRWPTGRRARRSGRGSTRGRPRRPRSRAPSRCHRRGRAAPLRPAIAPASSREGSSAGRGSSLAGASRRPGGPRSSPCHASSRP